MEGGVGRWCGVSGGGGLSSYGGGGRGSGGDASGRVGRYLIPAKM